MQRLQTFLASSIWVMAGPVFPTGRKALDLHRGKRIDDANP
jgi:hypothetical protein